MDASMVTPKILTVEFAIIMRIPATKDGLIKTELLEEFKLINSDLVNLKRTVLFIHKHITAMQCFSRGKTVFTSAVLFSP